MHKKFVVYGEWERYIKAVEARLSDGAKLDKEDDLASHFVDTVTTPGIALGKRKTRTDDMEREQHAELEGVKGYYFLDIIFGCSNVNYYVMPPSNI
jgi:hypothetical protein